MPNILVRKSKLLGRILAAGACLTQGAGSARAQSQGYDLVIDQHRGTPELRLDLPPLPSRPTQPANLQMVYNNSPVDSHRGFGVGWRIESSSIEIMRESGVPAHDYASRMNFDTGDTLYTLSLDGEKLSYLELQDPDVVYTLEKKQQRIRIIRHDEPFSVSLRNAQGALETINIGSGFEVLYADGRKGIYSGDLAVAEGYQPAGDSELPFVSRWPLVYEIAPGGEAIQYHYRVHGGRSILSEISFASGASRYIFNWKTFDNRPADHSMGYRQDGAYLYTRMVACFHEEPLHTWLFDYGRELEADFSEADCKDAAAAAAESGWLESSWSSLKAEIISLKDWTLEQFTETPSDTTPLLKKLYRFGRHVGNPDDKKIDRLPNLSFSYTSAAVPMDSKLVRDIGGITQSTGIGLNGDTDFMDINHDGLLDTIRYNGKESIAFLRATDIEEQKAGTGQTFTLKRRDALGMIQTVVPRLNDSASSLLYLKGDFNGDGWTDIAEVQESGTWSVFMQKAGEKTFTGSVNNVRLMGAQRPTELSISSSLLRQGLGVTLDVNADGKTDVILPNRSSGKLAWDVYLNVTERGASLISFERKVMDFPFPSTELDILKGSEFRFEDMNHDGLVDFVRFLGQEAGDAVACVYENTGRSGFKGNGKSLFRAPKTLPCDVDQTIRLPEAEGLNRKQFNSIWMIDINQDLKMDIVDLSPDRLRLVYWLQGSHALEFAAPQELPLFADGMEDDALMVDPENKFNTQVLDIDHDGSDEILVYQKKDQRIRIIDLNGSTKSSRLPAHRLQKIEQDDGFRQQLFYTSTASEALRSQARDPSWKGLGLPYTDFLVKYRLTQMPATSRHQETTLETFQYNEPIWHYGDGTFLGYRHSRRLVPGAYDEKLKKGEDASIDETSFAYDPEDPEANRLLDGQVVEVKTWSQTWDEKAEQAYSEFLDLFLQQSGGFAISAPDFVPSASPRLARVELTEFKIWSQGTGQTSPLQGHKLKHNFIAAFRNETFTCGSDSPDCQMAAHETEESIFDSVAERVIETTRLWDAIEGPDGFMIPERRITTKYKYDEASEVLHIYDNIALMTSYDADGRVVEKSSMEYDNPFGKISKLTRQQLVHAGQTEMPSALRPFETGQGLQETTIYTYDPSFGNLIKKSDRQGVLASYEYDAEGLFLLSESNALDHRIVSCYSRVYCPKDSQGEISEETFKPSFLSPVYVKQPEGAAEWMDYDDLGRLRSSQNSFGLSKKYSYRRGAAEAYALVEAETNDPTNAQSKKELQAFDATGQLRWVARYDSPGKIALENLSRINRRGATFFVADPLRVQANWEDLLSSPQTLDTQSLRPGVITVRDSLGRILEEIKQDTLTSNSYHAWGVEQWSQRDEEASTQYFVGRGGDDWELLIDENGSKHFFTRDESGRLLSMQSEGEPEPTRYGYDGLGQINYVHVPGLIHRLLQRDERGQVISVLNLSAKDKSSMQQLQIKYDELSRPLTLHEKTATGTRLLQSFVYDRMTDAKGQTWSSPGQLMVGLQVGTPYDTEDRFRYDNAGRMLEANRVFKAKDSTTAAEFTDFYQYAASGLMLTHTTANKVHVIYNYDALDNPSEIQIQNPWENKAKTVFRLNEYAGNGLLGTATYGDNSFSRTHEYNQRNELTSLRVCSSANGQACTTGSIWSKDFVFDRNARLLEQHQTVDEGENLAASFGYSQRGELLKAQDQQRVLQWRYGKSGDILRNDQLGQEALNTGLDSLQQPKGTVTRPSSFDEFGRLRAFDRVERIDYNFLDQVTELKTKSSHIQFGFDGAGEGSFRILNRNGKLTTIFMPDPMTTAGAQEKITSLQLPGDVLLHIDSLHQETVYELKDPTELTAVWLDPKGQVLGQDHRTPFGWTDPTRADKPARILRSEAPLGFGKRRTDPETGWQLEGSRLYVPELTAFATMNLDQLMESDGCSAADWRSCLLYQGP